MEQRLRFRVITMAQYRNVQIGHLYGVGALNDRHGWRKARCDDGLESRQARQQRISGTGSEKSSCGESKPTRRRRKKTGTEL
jgi:hypothetical protein